MTNEKIHKIALAHGFRDRPQPDGTIGLNAYVYEFARAMFEAGQAAAPAGWKLVPIASTEDMQDAGSDHCGSFGTAQKVWKAMLAAAPEVKP